MIEPTPGRIVWFYPRQPHPDLRLNRAGSHAAIVVYVVDSRTVNLAVFSTVGEIIPRALVKLLQDDDAAPEAESYATWMPYQRAQASKEGRAGW